GIRDRNVTGVQTCALPICQHSERGRCAKPDGLDAVFADELPHAARDLRGGKHDLPGPPHDAVVDTGVELGGRVDVLGGGEDHDVLRGNPSVGDQRIEVVANVGLDAPEGRWEVVRDDEEPRV